jgi:membrane protein YqaA with SNARE-associated domain
MEYLSEFGYSGLFVAAFLAATILPLSSEVVLTALLLNGLSPVALVLVATVGNVAGSIVNYALGYWASLEVVKRWIKISEEEFIKAEQRFTKYGLLSLLFAWVPIIGDPITVVAGILRIRLSWFVALVTAGKFIRYVVISYLALQVR